MKSYFEDHGDTHTLVKVYFQDIVEMLYIIYPKKTEVEYYNSKFQYWTVKSS